jgi:YVTN family beta-propeller protein
MRIPHLTGVLSRRLLVLALALLTAGLPVSFLPRPARAQAGLPGPFRNFESPQVHPLAVTPDGTRLLAVNSPNATLSVFQIAGGGPPVLTAEIPVGLEPVSVAARDDREAWVVNWLSDSVSVVDLTTGNVVRTIDVGDEPTDVLFAGLNREMAFVCVSGPAQVKVFDPSDAAARPVVLDIPGKQPRALARDAQGGQVFVSVFESGNNTTLVPEPLVSANGGLPPPSPSMGPGLPVAPRTSLIVKWNGSAWADETGNTRWNALVNYTLADVDLVSVDATGQTPAVRALVRNLGTHLGNMAFDPTTSRLFLANLESDSVRRFEPNLRGVFQSSRVSVLDAPAAGAPALSAVRDLNPHLDLSNPNGTEAERAQSLSMPADIVRASDGTIFVAATGNARVGVLAPTGVVTGRIAVGQGPTGLALDEPRSRLYVLNRFDQTVSVVDTNARSQVAQIPVGFNPEPAAVRNGRRFLYDASFSSHGTVSCASCHLSGHRDGLAWDLGDPRGALLNVRGTSHHPMKGPMTTQSLRGIGGTEPLHWRGDKNNLAEFNSAFTALLGSPRLLTTQEMQAFEGFVRTLVYPPNPNQNPDRSFPSPASGPSAARGAQLFQGNTLQLNGISCNTCHRTFPGFQVGSDFFVFPGAILGEPQAFKVPQLRGLYQKAGLQRPAAGQPPTEQLTGFGFIHDGSFDTLLNFLRIPLFRGFNNDNERRDVEAFLLAFDSGTAPAVGLQVTVNGANKNAPEVTARLNLLTQQAAAGNCDLVVKGIYGGRPRGFARVTGGLFQPDSSLEAPVTLQTLVAAADAGSELTFTGVPPGAGRRMGIDRELDNTLDDDGPRRSVRLSGRVVDGAGRGLGGVTMRLSGAQNAVARTDAAGRFAFNFVSTAGSHTLTPEGTGLDFTPQSRTIVNPSWNQSAAFVAGPPGNPSATSDFFVRQHYNDFLLREGDEDGVRFWTKVIEDCGADVECRRVNRVNVSASFFLSIEFQQTGYLAYLARKASFGDLPGSPVPTTFASLMSDTQRLGANVIVNVGEWRQQLETNKQAFFAGWVQRPEFAARFPAGTAPAAFVAGLDQNAGGVLTPAEATTLTNQLSANNTPQGRAAVVRAVAENAEFSRREFRRAFVLMQYYGYLQRNPSDAPDGDFSGWQFWLDHFNRFDGNFVAAELVKAFIESQEYRRRFGPL